MTSKSTRIFVISWNLQRRTEENHKSLSIAGLRAEIVQENLPDTKQVCFMIDCRNNPWINCFMLYEFTVWRPQATTGQGGSNTRGREESFVVIIEHNTEQDYDGWSAKVIHKWRVRRSKSLHLCCENDVRNCSLSTDYFDLIFMYCIHRRDLFRYARPTVFKSVFDSNSQNSQPLPDPRHENTVGRKPRDQLELHSKFTLTGEQDAL